MLDAGASGPAIGAAPAGDTPMSANIRTASSKHLK